jgi:hypothetical protein
MEEQKKIDPTRFTIYDLLNNKELWKEIHRRGYTCSWNRVGWRMRQILLDDDLKHKKPIPYLECPSSGNPTLPEVLK